jgi:hypothetical protein
MGGRASYGLWFGLYQSRVLSTRAAGVASPVGCYQCTNVASSLVWLTEFSSVSRRWTPKSSCAWPGSYQSTGVYCLARSSNG